MSDSTDPILEDDERLLALAAAWIAGDPDPVSRAELQALVDADDIEALRERVDGTLEFGTAGIRGVVGAGPLRMNRAVVIRTTAGFASFLDDTDAASPVVVGFDGRHDSRRFAADTVGVLHAAGIPVRIFPEPAPTPLVAYTAKECDAAGAVVVTASHNPPEYNGYKVYDQTAAQIVPPTDAAIADAIDAAPPADEVDRTEAPLEADGVEILGDEVFERYLDAVDEVRTPPADPSALTFVYTPLHGVGWRYVERACHRAGYTGVRVVEQQADPDGDFPTVSFPNPEEPGALDLAMETADDAGADLILANDPDADRLAVVVRLDDGTWQPLTGNQIGALLADHVLRNSTGRDRLVVSSIVSSPMLAELADAHGVHVTQTLTGFKWICAAALDLAEAGQRFVFGYEEALGYSVGPVVRDKDGIGALLAFADLATSLAERGTTVRDHLAELYREHGLWVSDQLSVVRPGLEGQEEIAAAMTRIDEDRAPDELDGVAVTAVTDYRTGAEDRPRWLPTTPLVAVHLDGGSRALIRPSGTEPKLKIYVDLRGDVDPDADVWVQEATLRRRAEAIAADLAAFVGLSAS
jgi:phosphomannomutase